MEIVYGESMMAVCLLDLFRTIVTKTPHDYITSNISVHTRTYECIEYHTSNIWVIYEYLRVTYEYIQTHDDIRVIYEYIGATYDGLMVIKKICAIFLFIFHIYMCVGHVLHRSASARAYHTHALVKPRSQGLSSLPPLVVGRKILAAAGHVTTQNLGGKRICWVVGVAECFVWLMWPTFL